MAEGEITGVPKGIKIVISILVINALFYIFQAGPLVESDVAERLDDDNGEILYPVTIGMVILFFVSSFLLYKLEGIGYSSANTAAGIVVFFAVAHLFTLFAGLPVGEELLWISAVLLPLNIIALVYLKRKKKLFEKPVTYKIKKKVKGKEESSEGPEVSYVEKERREIITKEKVPMFLLDEIPEKCPKCGAPYRKKEEGACSHCGAVIKMKKRKI